MRDAFSPSGMLLKAALIAGAAPMNGTSVNTGLPLAPPPNFVQGFGRLDLSRSVPLAGNQYGPVWALQVADMVEVEHGNVHTFEGLLSTGGPLTVGGSRLAATAQLLLLVTRGAVCSMVSVDLPPCLCCLYKGAAGFHASAHVSLHAWTSPPCLSAMRPPPSRPSCIS